MPRTSINYHKKPAVKKTAPPRVVVETVSVDEATRQEKMLILKMQPYISLSAMRRGEGTDMDWRALQFRLYVAEQLVTLCMQTYDGLPETMIEEVKEAILILHSMVGEYPANVTSGMRLSLMETDIIRWGLIHADTMQDCTDSDVQLVVYRHVGKLLNQ